MCFANIVWHCVSWYGWTDAVQMNEETHWLVLLLFVCVLFDDKIDSIGQEFIYTQPFEIC